MTLYEVLSEARFLALLDFAVDPNATATRAALIASHRALAERVTQLAERVTQLEDLCNHYHVASHDGTDQCSQCHLDLRDPIHRRVDDARPQQIIFR